MKNNIKITAVLIFLCCMFPIGFILLGTLGLSWFTPYFNYALGVVVIIFFALALRTYTKNKNSAICCVNDKEIYTCPECGLSYKDKEWKDKCEAFCKKYKSCNLEITEHAIKKL